MSRRAGWNQMGHKLINYHEKITKCFFGERFSFFVSFPLLFFFFFLCFFFFFFPPFFLQKFCFLFFFFFFFLEFRLEILFGLWSIFVGLLVSVIELVLFGSSFFFFFLPRHSFMNSLDFGLALAWTLDFWTVFGYPTDTTHTVFGKKLFEPIWTTDV